MGWSPRQERTKPILSFYRMDAAISSCSLHRSVSRTWHAQNEKSNAALSFSFMFLRIVAILSILLKLPKLRLTPALTFFTIYLNHYYR